MSDWQSVLGIDWAGLGRNACDRSGECCRGAAQVRPWQTVLVQAAAGDATARDFLNQFVPYADPDTARREAPDAWAASWAIAQERGEADLILYRCRYLEGRSTCRIYEDRPQLCRDFPESPFGAIPACCGYATIARRCRAQVAERRAALEQELRYYQDMLNRKERDDDPDCG